MNVQLNYYYDSSNQQKNEREDTPPKTYYLEEESKVQTVRLNENTSPQPLVKYNEALKPNTVATKNP